MPIDGQVSRSLVMPLHTLETYTVPTGSVMPSVVQEVNDLREAGIDVRLEPIADPQMLSPEQQSRLDNTLTKMEDETRQSLAGTGQNPDVLYDTSRTHMPGVNQGDGAWGRMLKTALALGPLYEAQNTATLGCGIDPSAFYAPVLRNDSGGMVAAIDAVKSSPRGDAEVVISKHLEFIDKPLDDESRAFFQGCKDGKSIRTRAICAMDMVQSHLQNSSRHGAQDLVSVSLACGAAAPAYSMVKRQQELGNDFKEIIFVDNDPMALASAYSMAPNETIRGKLSLHLRDLISLSSNDNGARSLEATELTSFIEPHSADVVDILGLFEYFSDKLACDELKKAREIVRPGGVIIFGNMLDSRPQQTFFKDVVQWPGVKQRSVEKVMSLVEKAGFDMKDVSVRIPSNEGVYAVVAIRIPE